MDVLLQRIGRLHRHVRTDRPAGFRDAGVHRSGAGRARPDAAAAPGRGTASGSSTPTSASSRPPGGCIEAFAGDRHPGDEPRAGRAGDTPRDVLRIDAEARPRHGWASCAEARRRDGGAATGIARLHGIDRNKPFGELRVRGISTRSIRTRLGADDRLVDWAVVRHRAAARARSASPCRRSPSPAPVQGHSPPTRCRARRSRGRRASPSRLAADASATAGSG